MSEDSSYFFVCILSKYNKKIKNKIAIIDMAKKYIRVKYLYL